MAWPGLSAARLGPVTAAGWAANPYSFAGNDPVNQSDPLGLSPVTDAELAAYRDSNHGTIGNGIAAAGNWVQDNWEYIAAGALVVGGLAVMATGVGGPIGAAMIAGALTGAGGSIWSQKSTNGSVDWGKVGIDAAIGGATGLIGGGAGQAAVKMTSGLTSCLGKNILSGAIEGGIDGGASGGIQYLTSGQPITMQGLTNAVGEGALSGSLLGGGSGALASVSDVARYGCFTADVLMADGTTKPIDQVVVGDEVTAFNPETGQTEPRKVTDTFVHDNVATVRVTTSEGEITSTINHAFYVEDKGWLTVGELQEGDRLRTPEGKLVKVLTIQATGKTETVYNLAVEGLHNYHVQTNRGASVLVHNDSTLPCKNEDELLAQANAARDSELEHLSHLTAKERPATVVGAYNKESGVVGVGSSSKELQECAEASAARAVGGDVEDVRFTVAMRPNGGPGPYKTVPVCETYCEPAYGRDAFRDPATKFQSDGH